MSLLKSGQIGNCCHPNALMTLKEYLEDYASEETRKLGDQGDSEKESEGYRRGQKGLQVLGKHLPDQSAGRRGAGNSRLKLQTTPAQETDQENEWIKKAKPAK